MTGSAGRRGAALLVAVLLATGATLLAHGILVLATRELTASRAAARIVRLDHLAVTAVRRATDALSEVELAEGSGLLLVAADSVGEVVWEGGVRRLSTELWLVEGRAREGRAVRATAEVLWRLDPETRIDELGTPVSVGSGAPILLPGVPGEVSLGRLDRERLTARAGIAVEGRGTPGPVERFGACVDDPWNWGDPASPFCGERVVHVALAAGTLVDGGVGRGLLVGAGDLTLSGTRFEGLVLAEGTVRLTGGAAVTGMVVAGGGVGLSSDAVLIGARTAVIEALESAALGEPVRIPGSARIRLNR